MVKNQKIFQENLVVFWFILKLNLLIGVVFIMTLKLISLCTLSKLLFLHAIKNHLYLNK